MADGAGVRVLRGAHRLQSVSAKPRPIAVVRMYLCYLTEQKSCVITPHLAVTLGL